MGYEPLRSGPSLTTPRTTKLTPSAPIVEAMARFYGMLAGVSYAEPFLQKEVGVVEDLTVIPVKSI